MYVGKEDPLIHPWFWWHVINNAVQQYCDIFNWSLAPNLHSKTYLNVACDAEQIDHYDVLTLLGIVVHSCSKVMGFFLRWQNMVFIFKVQTWNFVCGIRRSFALTMENILSVWYTATPGWTSKFGKVWKTRCQNAATRTIIWRCFLVSWDDKYLWVMVSNNRHELYFCSKSLCFSSIHCFFGQIRYLNIRHERTLTSSPLMLKCSERYQETQEREPAHTGWCLVIQPQKFPRYFEIGS